MKTLDKFFAPILGALFLVTSFFAGCFPNANAQITPPYYNPANVNITGGAINGTTIGETTPANATASRLRIGASNDLYLTRYAAKQLMISGDGVGAATNAGWIAGSGHLSGYGFLYASTAVPGTTNYALIANASNTYVNATTQSALSVSDIAKFASTATLNTSVNPLSITDTTDSSSTSTGSLKTAGGLGVAKKSYFGDVLDVTKTTTGYIAKFDNSNAKPLYIINDSSGSGFGPNNNLSGSYMYFSSGGASNILATYILINADVRFDKTITAPGTTGAQTINKTTGRVNFAAGATSLVVTNSLTTANSICHVTKATNDATMRLGACVAATGSITIYADVAPAAETAVNFTVTN